MLYLDLFLFLILNLRNNFRIIGWLNKNSTLSRTEYRNRILGNKKRIMCLSLSLSPGALVCVMPILADGSVDFSKMALTTIPQERSESVDITVPTGTYRLFAFDLESNGILRMPISVAADNETVDVTTGGEGT